MSPEASDVIARHRCPLQPGIDEGLTDAELAALDTLTAQLAAARRMADAWEKGAWQLMKDDAAYSAFEVPYERFRLLESTPGPTEGTEG